MRHMPTRKRALQVKMIFPARRTGQDGELHRSVSSFGRMATTDYTTGWSMRDLHPTGRGKFSAFILRLYSKTLSALGVGAHKGEIGLFQHARGGQSGFVAIGWADDLHADRQAR